MWRFSIRELMLLTIIVALSVMWWLDRRRLEESSAGLLREKRQLEAERLKLQRIVQPILLRQLDQGMLLDPAVQRSKLKGRIGPKDD